MRLSTRSTPSLGKVKDDGSTNQWMLRNKTLSQMTDIITLASNPIQDHPRFYHPMALSRDGKSMGQDDFPAAVSLCRLQSDGEDLQNLSKFDRKSWQQIS